MQDSKPLATTSRRLTLSQALAVTRERLLWDRRAESWDKAGSGGLTKVVDAVLTACEPSEGVIALELGCGSGQVTIPLARTCGRVLAVDVSPRAIERLHAKCAAEGRRNVETLASPIEKLDLSPKSVDLIVSNYALHHLSDDAKADLMSRALHWLRPGGRLVIGDMMFGRGSDPADRVIISAKIKGLLRRGPGGWWRVIKNGWRFSLRLGEMPLPPYRWEALVREAGFHDVRVVPVVAEASILSAIRPLADETRGPVGHGIARSGGDDRLRPSVRSARA